MCLLKKEVLFSALMLILGITMVSNRAIAQENVPANLYGTVVDSTMQPLADIEVRIQGLDKAVTTDEQGRFSFDRLEPGNYTVVVQAPEYQPWSKEVEVTDEGKELQIVLKKAKEGEGVPPER